MKIDVYEREYFTWGGDKKIPPFQAGFQYWLKTLL
jgi:hypothetical protein